MRRPLNNQPTDASAPVPSAATPHKSAPPADPSHLRGNKEARTFQRTVSLSATLILSKFDSSAVLESERYTTYMVASSASSIRSVRRKPYSHLSAFRCVCWKNMLSYFSRVGPRPESSSSQLGYAKDLPSTPVRPGSSSSAEGKSPTQLRLEDLGIASSVGW